MNVLIIGSGNGGSWTIRGEQLGAALGARVRRAPSDDDVRWADVVVLIKRAGAAWSDLAHRFGKPVIWDALDFWRQPTDNHLPHQDALDAFWRLRDAINPQLVIGATKAMASAAFLYGPAVYLPHHAWPGLVPTPPPRARVHVVAYQGNQAYLGNWTQAIARECAHRGWVFMINPPGGLAMADLVVAFRDGQWDGWMCREWKSGVKCVNALAAGRPLITQPSAAVTEIAPAGTVIADPADLAEAFDAWTELRDRQQAAADGAARAAIYAQDAVASQFATQLLMAFGKGVYVHSVHAV